MKQQFAASRVTGTPEAIELIEALKERHGAVAFFHSGGSCEGTEPHCLTRGELLPDPDDIRVGEIGGAPVYIDGARYDRWGHPELVIDVAYGRASGICLDGLEERHFVTRSAQPPRRFRRLADPRRVSRAHQ